MLWTNDLSYFEIFWQKGTPIRAKWKCLIGGGGGAISLVKGNFVSLLPWSSLNELSTIYQNISYNLSSQFSKKILNECLEKQIRHIGWIMFASALPAW